MILEEQNKPIAIKPSFFHADSVRKNSRVAMVTFGDHTAQLSLGTKPVISHNRAWMNSLSYETSPAEMQTAYNAIRRLGLALRPFHGSPYSPASGEMIVADNNTAHRTPGYTELPDERNLFVRVTAYAAPQFVTQTPS